MYPEGASGTLGQAELFSTGGLTWEDLYASRLRPCLQRLGSTPPRRPVGSLQAQPTMLAVYTQHVERLLVLSLSAVDPSTRSTSLHGCRSHGYGAVYGAYWQMDTGSARVLHKRDGTVSDSLILCDGGAHWESLHIRFHSDNHSVQEAVRSGTSRCPNVLSQLRSLF